MNNFILVSHWHHCWLVQSRITGLESAFCPEKYGEFGRHRNVTYHSVNVDGVVVLLRWWKHLNPTWCDQNHVNFSLRGGGTQKHHFCTLSHPCVTWICIHTLDPWLCREDPEDSNGANGLKIRKLPRKLQIKISRLLHPLMPLCSHISAKC